MRLTIARKKLSAYLDGELPRKEIQEIEIHLDSCDRCRNELQKICKGKSLIRDFEKVEPPDPESVWQNIKRRLGLRDFSDKDDEMNGRGV